MKVTLASLTEGVVSQFEHEYSPESLELEFVDLIFKSPLKFSGTLEKGSDTLTVKGVLEADVERVCGRCLKTASDRILYHLSLYYEIAGKDSVDTSDDVREQLFVEQPMSYACQESCKGLCPYCGVDLNVKTCNCKTEKNNSPFSVLKAEKRKKKN